MPPAPSSETISYEPRMAPGTTAIYSANSLRRRTIQETAARVCDLFVGIGAPAGSEIEQGPQRFDSAEMPRILPRIARCIDQLTRPMQADDTIGPTLEHRQYRDRMTVGAVTSVVAAKAVVRGGEQLDVLPAFVARKRRDALDWRFGDDRQIASEPFNMRH